MHDTHKVGLKLSSLICQGLRNLFGGKNVVLLLLGLEQKENDRSLSSSFYSPKAEPLSRHSGGNSHKVKNQ